MAKFEFTTMDRIFSMLSRDLRQEKINELDIIEWTGLALGFMKVPSSQEQVIQFLEVKNYHCEIPNYLQNILQIAKFEGDYEKECPVTCNDSNVIQVKEIEKDINPCKEFVSEACDKDNYRIYWGELNLSYPIWIHSNAYQNNFTPVRLSNHNFFGKIVCKEKNYPNIYNITNCGGYEYTIVGTTERKLRFSFKEGLVAISYIRTPIDKETGYPLIPDNSNAISAILYFLKWKIAEQKSWEGREGWEVKAQNAEKRWLKYVKQFNNIAKIPSTMNELQNQLEQTHDVLPNLKKYFGYFGSLGRSNDRNYNLTNRR